MKKIFIKKVLATSVISLMFVQILYVGLLEPTNVIAATANDVVVVTLNVDAGISISDGAAATMTPNIGLTSNKSVGSSSWIVKTSSASGYTLAVRASTSPALKKTATPTPDEFADYTPATAGTPETWSAPAVGNKEFGFSAWGANALAAFGTATTCGNTTTGVVDTNAKFINFGTSDYTIASSSTFTNVTGVTTNICFAAEQNAVYAASGAYTATITATATTQ